MSYRGKKHIEERRALRKRALQEDLLPGSDHRGVGGSYRHLKRQKKKRLLAEEAQRKAAVDVLIAQADALMKEAALYAPWCPEAAQEVTAQADALRRRAEEAVMPPKKAVRPVIRMPRHSAYTVYRSVQPPSQDPQSVALAEMIRSGERNFMNGISYRIDPVDTLKMVTASSVFGEPQYYRHGETAEATIMNGIYGVDRVFAGYSLSMMDPFKGMNTAQVMEQAIDAALDADFAAVPDWAVVLREQYMMRLNPQVIMVRAAMHPGRQAYSQAHPGGFARLEQQVMLRADDVTHQVQYYLAQYGSKRGIPAILKRAWAQRISNLDAYAMSKYAHAGIGLVDVVRICHAKGPLVNTLMRNGSVPIPEGADTWERLRASGKRWQEILTQIRMPHMALLRNLRGIFSEVSDQQTLASTLALLRRGVHKGRQFPYRYLSAWQAMGQEKAPWVPQVQEALEECMDVACENLPSMPGRSAFLSDNSGSAWGTCTSEWGTMQVATIGNLSSVIGAMRAEAGVVFPFGDRLESVSIDKGHGVLRQTDRVNTVGKACGSNTENGIWLFFRDALLQRQHWDNIFIYSDMQAGHGGLYGINAKDYAALGACINDTYIDVNKLVKLYREQVNPRVNVYCIQTAGYTNVLVPEYGYRTAILYGWTGKELLFADALRRTWDALEQRNASEP